MSNPHRLSELDAMIDTARARARARGRVDGLDRLEGESLSDHYHRLTRLERLDEARAATRGPA